MDNFSNIGMGLNSNLVEGCWIGDPIDYYQPIVEKYYYNYPIYTWYTKEKSKTAFDIAQSLIKNNFANTKSVKEFIDLVNLIVDQL